MKYVGAHVSIRGGVENAPLNAIKIGAKAFALFTKNQRQWHASPLTSKNIDEFKKNLLHSGIPVKHILPHNSYLINLGNPDKSAREKSLNAFIDEVERCRDLELDRLNFHPGSHLKKCPVAECLQLVAAGLNKTLNATSGVSLVIETTAGQGGNIGYRFEQIAELIEMVEDKSRIGVCIDTCHIFSAGYDIRDKESYEATMSEFDEIVGFKYLMGMHLNDSKANQGSAIDRHHSIGFGTLGKSPFSFIMNDDRLNDIPLILETIDESLWAKEIEMLYGMVVSPEAVC